jgi:CRISPR-associated exonuclease Cas4
MDIENLQVNGTLVWYYFICKREVWLIGHGIEPQQENDFIQLGRHIHEVFYSRRKKELTIDNKIKIDLLPSGKVIGEVKKSSRYLESAKMQLAFYIYYMKHQKGHSMTGELLIPKERKRIRVELTPQLEAQIGKVIENIQRILSLEKPPAAVKIPFCKNCAYKELCWA